MTPSLTFDDIYLGHDTEAGGTHLATARDVELARIAEESPLLLSNEAEMFCNLIVMHGMLPSVAYTQAFTKEVDGDVIKPDLPSFSARRLIGTLEVKQRIQELRDEVTEWGKTTYEDIEQGFRSIALAPTVKDSDRISALKALAQMKGFGNVDGAGVGGTIVIQFPFAPQNLSPIKTIEQSALDNEV
jgi:hypothetical protein